MELQKCLLWLWIVWINKWLYLGMANWIATRTEETVLPQSRADWRTYPCDIYDKFYDPLETTKIYQDQSSKCNGITGIWKKTFVCLLVCLILLATTKQIGELRLFSWWGTLYWLLHRYQDYCNMLGKNKSTQEISCCRCPFDGKCWPQHQWLSVFHLYKWNYMVCDHYFINILSVVKDCSCKNSDAGFLLQSYNRNS